MQWRMTPAPQPHETNLLYLDSAKVRSQLHWEPVWAIDATLAKTADWYRAWLESGQIISRQQLADYVATAAQANLEWAQA
jgi:CDP-glucose 4,6-dehydratase